MVVSLGQNQLHGNPHLLLQILIQEVIDERQVYQIIPLTV